MEFKAWFSTATSVKTLGHMQEKSKLALDGLLKALKLGKTTSLIDH